MGGVTARMHWLKRLLNGKADESRASMQDWVDLVLAAQDSGALLQTTMPNLAEETTIGNLNGVIINNGPVFPLTLARLQIFSQIRFQWVRRERGEVAQLFGDRALLPLERPWPGGTTADLLARMELDVTGAGNSYTRRLRRGPVQRLVRLRPEWVVIVLGSQEDPDHPGEAADVELLGYAYFPQHDRGPGRAQFFAPDEIAHYAPYTDPTGIFTGMSWVTPVLRDVAGDDLQTNHKRAFLRNAATPNLAIKFDPSIKLEQVKEFKAMMEAEHKGVANAYKTLFLGGGADPIAIGKDFKELEFAVTQGKGESRLAAAAGVPPSWVGFSEGLQGSALNAGNFTAARRRLGDGTMQHLWASAATSLETIVDRPDDGVNLWFQTRGIPFLAMDNDDQAAVQRSEAQTIVALVRDGFTPDSAIDAVVNNDWTRLEHQGVLSVQLQPPDMNGNNGNGDDDDGEASAGAPLLRR